MSQESKKVTVNRTYKSSLFALLYQNAEELLDLYNAVNGTNYTDSSLLEINTLENAIYMSMKNDVSFLFDKYFYLYYFFFQ